MAEHRASVFPRPDRNEVRRLVGAAGLPVEDLDELDLEHFFGGGRPEQLQGVVGLELCGEAALLRSLAVLAEARGTGLGRALVAAAEGHAWNHGVRSLYLLTTTAAGFFERLGDRPAARDQAPERIRGTREFGGLCPSSATFMEKRLADFR